jgi:hypothetical protein
MRGIVIAHPGIKTLELCDISLCTFGRFLRIGAKYDTTLALETGNNCRDPPLGRSQ